MESQRSSLVRFGVFEVDLAARELHKRGARVRLQDQPFRVLEALLEKPGQIVTREELKERLWAEDEFVEFDKSLNTSVQKIRQALDDSAATPRFVETIPRRGYRFVASVDSSAARMATAPPAPWTRWVKIGGLIAVAIGTLLVISTTQDDATRSSGAASQPLLRQLTFDTGLTAWPAVSADGTLLAYASDRVEPGNLDVWVQHIGGEGQPLRLTDDPYDDTEPAFSPDGAKIAFRSTREPSGIYMIPALGGPPTLLAANGWYPHFSPDGKWVVYQGRFGIQQLFLVPAAGGKPQRLGSNWLSSPVWSPNSSLILASGNTSSGQWWLLPVDGSPPKPIPIGDLREQIDLDRNERLRPEAWSLEGDRILFAAQRGGGRDMWQVRLDQQKARIAGEPERLTAGAGQVQSPRPASEGRWVFADARLSMDIWSFPVDHTTGAAAGPPQRLTRGGADEKWPTLSADGNRMLYWAERGGSVNLWLMDLSTGQETGIPTAPHAALAGRVSADGDSIEFITRNSQERLNFSWFTKLIGRGAPIQRFSGEGLPRSWRSTTGEVLLQWWSPEATEEWVAIHDVDTGVTKRILELDATAGFFHDPRLSWDANWMVGHRGIGPDRRQIYVASTRRDEVIDIAEAIAITDGSFSESKAVFSPDNNRLYYLSDRDGHFCIWTQAVTEADKRPVGDAVAVHHMHDPGPSIDNIGPAISGLLLEPGPDRLVLQLGDQSGNIWLLDRSGEP